MRGHAVLMSSARDDWETPDDLFTRYRREFDLCVDVAASRENRKLPEYFGPDHVHSEKRNGLAADWSQFGSRSRCWMNPSYSRGLQAAFLRKAAHERLRGVLTVALVPARTDTRVVHEVIYDASRWQTRPGIEIRFLPGRITFVGADSCAPFPSMIVVFRP